MTAIVAEHLVKYFPPYIRALAAIRSTGAHALTVSFVALRSRVA